MDYKLPIIYAGNKNAKENIKETFSDSTDLIMVPNIRPTLEKENLNLAEIKFMIYLWNM